MGLNTRGYIKGIGLLKLAGLVNQVVRDHNRSWIHNATDVELVDSYSQDITNAQIHFDFDKKATFEVNRFRPTLSETKETRRVWISSNTRESDSVTLPGGPNVVWGCLDVSMWGSCDEIIQLFLTEAKNQGYETYFQSCDCGDEPVLF